MFFEKSYLAKSFVFAVAVTFFFALFASPSFAAQRLGAIAESNARTQAANQAAANLGAGGGTGPGVDLKSIASPKKAQTFTGFPEGTLPGGPVPDRSNNPTGKAVFSGDPVDPLIGPEMLGGSLDRVFSIADHVGYGLVPKNYAPGALDAAYVFDVMAGRARRYVLYFDRSTKLMKIEFFEPVDKKWITF